MEEAAFEVKRKLAENAMLTAKEQVGENSRGNHRLKSIEFR